MALSSWEVQGGVTAESGERTAGFSSVRSRGRRNGDGRTNGGRVQLGTGPVIDNLPARCVSETHGIL